ncbi:hypothetical protein ACOT81_25420 [Streptomyces sp. WI04-05B]|uniref:hypothetical protein n=1 Tax=Streptomyces TaxID=1883 RepID=UPI0029B63076|nr:MULTISPECIES: hypothetical protein [unclassified Streptomyces]MDX2544836.1 hypothetical protein [Streptomyces sp. WI04-05B]MDX2588884.1 hypothetical protein [Streptomyces sp. WI04-05A]MDX3750737.1 hypothetical protein [Streptomyces sp. AK08-02]
MIKQVSHKLTAGTAATGPASLDLALGVAFTLHPPTATATTTTRAAEVATVAHTAAARRSMTRARRPALS